MGFHPTSKSQFINNNKEYIIGLYIEPVSSIEPVYLGSKTELITLITTHLHQSSRP